MNNEETVKSYRRKKLIVIGIIILVEIILLILLSVYYARTGISFGTWILSRTFYGWYVFALTMCFFAIVFVIFDAVVFGIYEAVLLIKRLYESGKTKFAVLAAAALGIAILVLIKWLLRIL